MRASVIVLGFLATLTVALPEAYPKAVIACQSVSALSTLENAGGISNVIRTPWFARLLTVPAKDAAVRDLLADPTV
jgi:hypothetical protein